MAADLPRVGPEHLTPHDLVGYSRCPHEMELTRSRHHTAHGAPPPPVLTPANAVPERHSPMFPPPLGGVRAIEGRLDIRTEDRVAYSDPGEEDLPMLFPPERIGMASCFATHGVNLWDDELGLSGRPDLVIERGESYIPLEYKSTHLFLGFHSPHGRGFDVIQAIAECRLVHAASGRRPPYGIVLYGDRDGDGAREGWVEVPYGPAEEAWLRAALVQVRQDRIRAPVPSDRNCPACEPNAAGLCRWAASRYVGHGLAVAGPSALMAANPRPLVPR